MDKIEEQYQKAVDKLGSEILSLKAVLLTALEKVDAMEKKMIKKPSKRAQNHQQEVDKIIARRRQTIERNRMKKANG